MYNEVDHPPPLMNNSSCTTPSGQPSSLNPLSQIISVGSAEAVSLPATALIITSSLMLLILIYSILTLVLIAIIWIVVGKKLWNIWKKSNQFFIYENYINRDHAKHLSTRPNHYYFQS